jgi:predicted AlkP superfamily phosphohydrolase/phosphomutase
MINLVGRQPKGIIEPGKDYESVRENVMDIMRQVIDPETNQPIIEACYRREDLFSGPFVNEMPDVFLLLRQGYKGDKRVDIGPVSPTTQAELERFRGEHTMDGIFMAAGPSIQSRATVRDANLIDLAPTLLYLMGVPIPEDMEGRVLSQAIHQEWLATSPIHRTSKTLSGYETQQRLTDEEEKEITDRLAGLGYVE